MFLWTAIVILLDLLSSETTWTPFHLLPCLCQLRSDQRDLLYWRGKQWCSYLLKHLTTQFASSCTVCPFYCHCLFFSLNLSFLFCSWFLGSLSTCSAMWYDSSESWYAPCSALLPWCLLCAFLDHLILYWFSLDFCISAFWSIPCKKKIPITDSYFTFQYLIYINFCYFFGFYLFQYIIDI